MQRLMLLWFICLLLMLPTTSPAESAAANEMPKKIPESDLKRTDGAHPEFMKRFAEWADDFFEHENEMREAARKMAAEYKSNPQPRGAEWVMELYKIGGVEINEGESFERNIEEKLNVNEREAYSTTLKGITFYLVQLPLEEGVKAGILPPPEHHESETPEVIKNYVKGILAPYKYNKRQSEAETIKEIEAVWNKMVDALLKEDVDEAVKYISVMTRDDYRQSFQALKEKGALKTAAIGMSDMKVVRVRPGHAEGDMRVKNNGEEHSFFVRFLLEGEGLWRIQSF